MAYAFFAFQQAGPLEDLRTLAQAGSAESSGTRNDEDRSRSQADAFALLGEVGSLDF